LNNIRTTVVGLGLIGGSVALSLREAGRVVTGFDVDDLRRQYSLDHDLIDRDAVTLESAVRDADEVFVAVPVLQSLIVLQDLDEVMSDEAVVVDAGSVKVPVVEHMQALKHAAHMVGGHPMAGREVSGPEHADPNLLKGRNFFLTPNAHTSPDVVHSIGVMVESMGAFPIVVDAHEHDRAAATTSHLPQLMSTVLAGMAGDDVLNYVGSAFRDATRIAASDSAMWRDIFVSNRDPLVSTAQEFLHRLQMAIDLIDRDDRPGIERLMLDGKSRAQLVAER